MSRRKESISDGVSSLAGFEEIAGFGFGKAVESIPEPENFDPLRDSRSA